MKAVARGRTPATGEFVTPAAGSVEKPNMQQNPSSRGTQRRGDLIVAYRHHRRVRRPRFARHDESGTFSTRPFAGMTMIMLCSDCFGFQAIFGFQYCFLAIIELRIVSNFRIAATTAVILLLPAFTKR
jgi:hypothetical protein